MMDPQEDGAKRSTVADCDHCLERLRSRLLVDLSHEFRTPLTLILGPLSDLESGRYGELSAAAREQLALMRRSARRLQGSEISASRSRRFVSTTRF